MEAGKRAIKVSDFSAGFKLFEKGILFLRDGSSSHWLDQYELSVQLFELASESACVLNDRSAVVSYSDELIANARVFEDKLNCKYVASFNHYDVLKIICL